MWNPTQLRTVTSLLSVTLCLQCVGFSGQVEAAQATVRRQGDWWIAESRNFSVWMQSTSSDCCAVIGRCEMLRNELLARWRAADGISGEDWMIPCVVVVHPQQEQFARAVPVSSRQATGCTTVTVDERRVIFRRIDLRADARDWSGNALPHELTHVILADQFSGQEIPGWLNEGIAMLSESKELLARRRAVLIEASRAGRLPTMTQILAAGEGGATIDLNLLYACRCSLLQYLENAEDRTLLCQFTREVVTTKNCDRALRNVYRFEEGLIELDRRWRKSVEATGRELDRFSLSCGRAARVSPISRLVPARQVELVKTKNEGRSDRFPRDDQGDV